MRFVLRAGLSSAGLAQSQVDHIREGSALHLHFLFNLSLFFLFFLLPPLTPRLSGGLSPDSEPSVRVTSTPNSTSSDHQPLNKKKKTLPPPCSTRTRTRESGCRSAVMADGKWQSGARSPLDGGWGWVIVGCCFMVTVCTRAVTR